MSSSYLLEGRFYRQNRNAVVGVDRDVDHSLRAATSVLVQAPTCSYVSLLIGFPAVARGILSECMSDHFSPLLRIF